MARSLKLSPPRLRPLGHDVGLPSAYDDEIWELLPDDPGPPPEHLAAFVRQLPPVERALDLGCGDGRLTRELRASELVAADVSKVALERARRWLPGIRLAELRSDEPLPFPDAAFDLVLCAETLEHVRDVQLLLSEARRILRPGGTLAITTPVNGRVTGMRIVLAGFETHFDPLSPHLRFFTRRSLSLLLSEMGFAVHSLQSTRGTLLATARR